MSPTRDREVGAGYDYQWDVGVLLLLSCVLTPQRSVRGIDEDFAWLGPISHVYLEGNSAQEALEDLTFYDVSGRRLHFQIKERENDGTRWKKRDEKLIEFLNRAAEYAEATNRRFSLLSNGPYDPTLQKLLEDPDALAKYRNGEVRKHFSKSPEQVQPVARYKRLGEVVRLRCFLEATELGPDKWPVSGVAYMATQRLYELGVRSPEEAYLRIYAWVKNLSIRKGRVKLAVDEVRQEFLALLGLTEADVARRRHVHSLLGILGDPRRTERGQFTLKDIRDGQLFQDDEELQLAEALLNQHQKLLVQGHRAAGKTVFIAQLAVRASGAGALPVLWDFENMSSDLPVQASDYLADVATVARVFDRRPMLVLENVHLKPSTFQMVLSLMSGFAGMALLASARGDVNLQAQLSEAQAQELKAATFSLDQGQRPRGERILHWHLTRKKGLSDSEVQRVYASVSWSDYVGDLVLLASVLDAYDWNSYALPAWAVHARLKERLEHLRRKSRWADDLLFIVAALGRSGLPVDYKAAARMLSASESEFWQLVLQLSDDGILVLGEGLSLVRFWHQSMAKLFWQLFQVERGQMARDARRALKLEEA